MAVRPIDAVQVLKDINWHHKPTPVNEFESGFNQRIWLDFSDRRPPEGEEDT